MVDWELRLGFKLFMSLWTKVCVFSNKEHRNYEHQQQLIRSRPPTMLYKYINPMFLLVNCSCLSIKSLIHSCGILSHSSVTAALISASVVGCLWRLCNACLILLQHFSIRFISGLVEG